MRTAADLVGGTHVLANSVIRRCASVAYAGIRTPLVLVDQRLPEGSRVRTGLDVALAGLDSSARRLLGAPERRPTSTDARSAASWEQEREAIAASVRQRQADVGELADPDLDVADVQAELQAKHTLEAREEARRRREHR